MVWGGMRKSGTVLEVEVSHRLIRVGVKRTVPLLFNIIERLFVFTFVNYRLSNSFVPYK